jgi:hypothetical protein
MTQVADPVSGSHAPQRSGAVPEAVVVVVEPLELQLGSAIELVEVTNVAVPSHDVSPDVSTL